MTTIARALDDLKDLLREKVITLAQWREEVAALIAVEQRVAPVAPAPKPVAPAPKPVAPKNKPAPAAPTAGNPTPLASLYRRVSGRQLPVDLQGLSLRGCGPQWPTSPSSREH